MKLHNCHNPRKHISKKNIYVPEIAENTMKVTQNRWHVQAHKMCETLIQPSSWIAVISCNDNYWLHSSAPYHGCKINKYIKSTQNTWQTIIQNLCPEFLKHVPEQRERLSHTLLDSPPPKIEMALPMLWQKSLNYTIFPTHVSYRSSPWRRDTTVGVSMQQTHPIWFVFPGFTMIHNHIVKVSQPLNRNLFHNGKCLSIIRVMNNQGCNWTNTKALHPLKTSQSSSSPRNIPSCFIFMRLQTKTPQ